MFLRRQQTQIPNALSQGGKGRKLIFLKPRRLAPTNPSTLTGVGGIRKFGHERDKLTKEVDLAKLDISPRSRNRRGEVPAG